MTTADEKQTDFQILSEIFSKLKELRSKLSKRYGIPISRASAYFSHEIARLFYEESVYGRKENEKEFIEYFKLYAKEDRGYFPISIEYTKQEEECPTCHRKKDVGQKCWCCGC